MVDGDQLRLEDPFSSGRRVVVYSDGGSRGNPGPAGFGAVVLDPSTSPPRELATVSEAIGVTTNNVAEYRGAIAALETAAQLGATEVELRADSKLVVEQLSGSWRVKQDHLRPLFERARALMKGFERVQLRHVPRDENTHADALANQAMDAASDGF